MRRPWERSQAFRGGTRCQGKPEAPGTGEEQSYDPIVPLKVGNRRATLEVAATVPAGGKG
jgi:hypothetical protein